MNTALLTDLSPLLAVYIQGGAKLQNNSGEVGKFFYSLLIDVHKYIKKQKAEKYLMTKRIFRQSIAQNVPLDFM